MTTKTHPTDTDEGYAAALRQQARAGGLVTYDRLSRRFYCEPATRTRAAGAVPYVRSPASRRAKVAQLETEVLGDLAAAAARHQSIAAFGSGEVVRVQRRRTPSERLGELDRERVWRGNIL
jgi:hypothetical protein